MKDIYKEILDLINKGKESTTYDDVTYSNDTNVTINIKEIKIVRGSKND